MKCSLARHLIVVSLYLFHHLFFPQAMIRAKAHRLERGEDASNDPADVNMDSDEEPSLSSPPTRGRGRGRGGRGGRGRGELSFQIEAAPAHTQW